MPYFDLPIEELRQYCPPRVEMDDFDRFWRDTLAEVRRHPLAARFEPADFGLRAVETLDVTFNGYGGQPIKGRLLLPSPREGPPPCILEYIGHSGGARFPPHWLVLSTPRPRPHVP